MTDSEETTRPGQLMPEDSSARIALLRAETDRLQAELDAIANRATDRWLGAAQFESKALAAMQQTVSWRITRPLRIVRSLPHTRELLRSLSRARLSSKRRSG